MNVRVVQPEGLCKTVITKLLCCSFLLKSKILYSFCFIPLCNIFISKNTPKCFFFIPTGKYGSAPKCIYASPLWRPPATFFRHQSRSLAITPRFCPFVSSDLQIGLADVFEAKVWISSVVSCQRPILHKTGPLESCHLACGEGGQASGIVAHLQF